MQLILSALIVAAAVIWSGARIARRSVAREDENARLVPLLELLAPGIAEAADNPRALLAWQPVVAAARRLFPSEFNLLDQAVGGTFPFSSEQIQAAHARWTADWLAWERAHDAEFKLKAFSLEQELGERASTPVGRARIDAVEREKIDLYQRRYAEYSRVARALQELMRP